MHKIELIQRLHYYVVCGKSEFKGQDIFAEYFALWLEQLHIPPDRCYDSYDIVPFLPQLAIDAFEDFRTATDKNSVRLRTKWKKVVGRKVPNITDIGASPILDQNITSQTTIGFLLKEVVGTEYDMGNITCLEKDIEAYSNAQHTVLQQLFDKFLRRVYRKGMFRMMGTHPVRHMSGRFNGTELRTSMIAGRVMFTFARKIDPNKLDMYRADGHFIYNEHMVSWAASDNDPLGLNAEIKFLCTDFHTGMNMIEDVINHWPTEQAEQEKVFTNDESVSIS